MRDKTIKDIFNHETHEKARKNQYNFTMKRRHGSQSIAAYIAIIL
jgi:hypothetical protein